MIFIWVTLFRHVGLYSIVSSSERPFLTVLAVILPPFLALLIPFSYFFIIPVTAWLSDVYEFWFIVTPPYQNIRTKKTVFYLFLSPCHIPNTSGTEFIAINSCSMNQQMYELESCNISIFPEMKMSSQKCLRQ